MGNWVCLSLSLGFRSSRHLINLLQSNYYAEKNKRIVIKYIKLKMRRLNKKINKNVDIKKNTFLSYYVNKKYSQIIIWYLICMKNKYLKEEENN
jgi:hypothetical protein